MFSKIFPLSLLVSTALFSVEVDVENNLKEVGEIQRKMQAAKTGEKGSPELATRLSPTPQKNQITYLMQVGEVEKSIRSLFPL